MEASGTGRGTGVTTMGALVDARTSAEKLEMEPTVTVNSNCEQRTNDNFSENKKFEFQNSNMTYKSVRLIRSEK